MPIQFFFGVRNSINALGSGCGAEPLGDYGIVSLTERCKELFASDGDAFIRHRGSPGDPMELL
jgi:hypothetical protein